MEPRVRQIIEYHDKDIKKPMKDIQDMRDMMVDLISYASNYQPESNSEYACGEVYQGFFDYTKELVLNGSITTTDREDLLLSILDNLRRLCNWEQYNESMMTRMFRKFIVYQKLMRDYPDAYVANPLRTMAPEVICEILEVCVFFYREVNSESFWQVMKDRFIDYYEKDAAEGMMDGHVNVGKILATLRLMKMTGRKPSEEFEIYHKLIQMFGEEELKKYEGD